MKRLLIFLVVLTSVIVLGEFIGIAIGLPEKTLAYVKGMAVGLVIYHFTL